MLCMVCSKNISEIHIVDYKGGTEYLCSGCRNQAVEQGGIQVAWWANLNLTGEELSRPCMQPAEIELISSILEEDIVNVFEYGSGGSTLYFPQRIKNPVFEYWYSVEHNPYWWLQIKKLLDKRGNTDNVHPILSPSETGRWEESKETLEEDEKVFKNYVDSPDVYIVDFDVFLIDGVARNGCLKKAANRVSKDGYIILHDAERTEDYIEGLNYLDLHKFKIYEHVEVLVNGEPKRTHVYRRRKKWLK